MQLILFHYVGRKHDNRNSHIIRLWHCTVQVKVLDINNHEACVGSGDDNVEEEICCEELSCRCRIFTFVLDLIATYGPLDVIGIFPLCTIVGN